MKKYKHFLVVFFALLVSVGFSQEKSKKERKAEIKIERMNEMEQLIANKDFVFVANRAFPLGMSPVELTSNINSIVFTPDLIDSTMPYYGTGYSGVSLNRDRGLRFKGEPEEFKVVKNKKGYQIELVVNGETDTYSLSLEVGPEGSAFLTISSNDRGTISYQGEILTNKKV